MAYDSVRRQLDQLMGVDRNGPVGADRAKRLTYSDPEVCKNYLLGLCPHDLAIKRRNDNGICPLTHSDELREAYLKADASGSVHEKGRWLRDLRAECRDILADEDRRIRNHARRLQEAYSAPSHAGLMVKSFETLRALHMVSATADPNVLDSHDGDAASDEGDAADFGRSSRGTLTSKISSNVKEDNTKVSNPNEAEKKDDDEEDFEGFGEIKVIPASSNSRNATNSENNALSNPDEAVQAAEAQPTRSIDPQRSPSSDDDDSNDRGEISSDSEIEKNNSRETAADVDTARQRTVSETDDKAEKSAVAQKEEISNQDTQTESVMEKYYRLGVGPDGLLMLDKKNSLRVCSSCGGYISLFDAESRLLSHYRGKTHRSLETLRKKLRKLDDEIAAESLKPSWTSRRDESTRENAYGRGWEGSNARDSYDKPMNRYDTRRSSHSSRMPIRSPRRDEQPYRAGYDEFGRRTANRMSPIGSSPRAHHHGSRESSHYKRRSRDSYDHRSGKRYRNPSPDRRRQRTRHY